MGILVEGVVFEIVSQFVLFEMGIILFTAISSICNDAFRLVFQLLEMRDQADWITTVVVYTVPNDELSLCSYLHIVGRLGPSFFSSTIFLHAHTSSLWICLGVTISSC